MPSCKNDFFCTLHCNRLKPLCFLKVIYHSLQLLREIEGHSGFINSVCFDEEGKISIERFYSRGQHLYRLIGTKESVYIRKEFDSQRIFLVHQHGRRFIVLEHQYSRRDVM